MNNFLLPRQFQRLNATFYSVNSVGLPGDMFNAILPVTKAILTISLSNLTPADIRGG
jgi:hypothetical protein